MRTPVNGNFVRLQFFVTSIVLSLLIAPSTLAQTQITTGTIQGTVVDANGAVVPGANVEIKNLDTNISRNVTTDEDGRFAALALQPGHTAALGNLATLLEPLNRLEAARETVDRGLALAPGDPLLNLVAAKLERRDGRPEAGLDRLEPLRGVAMDEGTRCSLIAELGRLYDRAGRWDEAFAAFTESNRMALSLSPEAAAEAERYRRKLDLLAGRFTPEWVASWSRIEARQDRRDPVFLVGFPRSGTTLLEQMLGAHPGFQTLEERPTVEAVSEAVAGLPGGFPDALAGLTEAEAAALRSVYSGAVAREAAVDPERQLVDKMPLNLVDAGMLQRLFPAARFILVLRHPCDACLSCFMQDFVLNGAMANFVGLESAAALYDRAMALWRRYLDLLPIDHHALRYEDLVQDPEATLRALLGFLEADWQPAMLDYAEAARSRPKIDTPSYHQVTEPLYRRAKDRWRHYRAHLEPVLPVLMPWIGAYGYDC